MADFKKLKDGQGNSYNVKDETARTNLANHTGNTSNPHSVTKAQVGLGNVDNTSDANKPVSTAQQAALNLKVNTSDLPNIVRIINVTDSTTTLGQIANQLNSINANHEHYLFDVSALGASMYLCTIFIDTTNNIYRIFDMVVNRLSEGTYDASKLLTMAIANADTIAKQKQIDSLQTQIDELGGSHVIENLDTLADLIESGDSTNYINAGDTIDFNWINTVLGTITSGATVTCADKELFITKVGEAEEKTYLFVFNGTKWTYNEVAIDDITTWGLSISGTPTTGDVMTIQTTVTTVNYTFVGYDDIDVDGNATHNWLLEQTYAPSTKAYDALEALFNLADGNTLPAGNYKITVNQQGGSSPVTLYFNIASDVVASGSAIQFASTSVNWTSPYYPTTTRGYVYGTTTTATPSIALSTTEIAGAVDISTITGITIHDCYYQCNFGNNNWERSNIRAWLNDDSKNGDYTPSYAFDRPSAYNLGQGFLYGLDPRVKKIMLTSQVKFTAGIDNEGYTQNQTYTVHDKVFLLSMKEMSFNINTNEGNATDLYSEYTNNTLTNDAVANRSKYNQAGGTKNSYRWSRSAISSYSYYSWLVNASGSYDYTYAYNGYYYAPAFAIGKAS